MTGEASKPAGGDYTLRQRIWIKATPERVYRALTTRDDLVRWFVSDLVADVRVGGAIRFVFASCGATLAGEYLALERNRKVSFTFDASRVTFELEAQEGGTLVQLTDEELPRDIDQVAGQAEGWSAYLCNLKVLIELGRDLRSDQPSGTILPK